MQYHQQITYEVRGAYPVLLTLILILLAPATGPEADYSASTIDLTFNETVTAHTINITITDDGLLEYDETLQSTVSLVTSEDGVTLNPDATTITILDDDCKFTVKNGLLL